MKRQADVVVVLSSDSVTIEGTGSTNLTGVNGRRLTSAHGLCSGDELCIGSVTLRFEGGSSSGLAQSAPSAQRVLRVRRRVRIGRAILFDAVSSLGILAALLGVVILALILVNSVGGDSTTGDAVLPVIKGSYEATAEFGQSGSIWKKDHTGLDFAAPRAPKFTLSLLAR